MNFPEGLCDIRIQRVQKIGERLFWAGTTSGSVCVAEVGEEGTPTIDVGLKDFSLMSPVSWSHHPEHAMDLHPSTDEVLVLAGYVEDLAWLRAVWALTVDAVGEIEASFVDTIDGEFDVQRDLRLVSWSHAHAQSQGRLKSIDIRA